MFDGFRNDVGKIKAAIPPSVKSCDALSTKKASISLLEDVAKSKMEKVFLKWLKRSFNDDPNLSEIK